MFGCIIKKRITFFCEHRILKMYLNTNKIMKTVNFKGVYTQPVLEEFSVKCEQGFAQSADVEGLTPIEGEWDE